MLVHLVMKMAKILQPSVLFLNAAEKPFYKKVPPEEKDLEPKRLGPVLLKKVVKTIKPEDRVMLLGLCKQPWAAAKKMNKVYDKVKKSEFLKCLISKYSTVVSYQTVLHFIPLGHPDPSI